MQFRVFVVTDPQTNTQRDRGDYNTLRCSSACSVINWVGTNSKEKVKQVSVHWVFCHYRNNVLTCILKAKQKVKQVFTHLDCCRRWQQLHQLLQASPVYLWARLISVQGRYRRRRHRRHQTKRHHETASCHQGPVLADWQVMPCFTHHIRPCPVNTHTQTYAYPQGNQELLVVEDKVGRPPGEFGVSKSMQCDIFPSVVWHCWLGDRKGIRPAKKLDVGLLLVMIWLGLCSLHDL